MESLASELEKVVKEETGDEAYSIKTNRLSDPVVDSMGGGI
jgi:NitT/TauT family transport system ATP-binding protein